MDGTSLSVADRSIPHGGDQPLRESVVGLESHMRTLLQRDDSLNVETPLAHHFAEGLYGREIFMPAHALIVSKIQKFSHFIVLLSGRVIVMTNQGPREFTAPAFWTSEAGEKRVIYTYTDTTWITVHASKSRDLNALENELIAENYDVYDNLTDYKLLLTEHGLTDQEVRYISENRADQTLFPIGPFKFAIRPSNIDGLGVFARSEIADRETIGLAKIGDKRTVLGRHLNHARWPNAYMRVDHDDVLVIAAQTIAEGSEITVNYRQVHAVMKIEGAP